MNRPQLHATHLILLAVLATCLSPSRALAFDGELPPYTDYCTMLAQEIQGRKHAFLAGNLTYYVGGQYACWRHTEDETIGLTHPFHHDLRGRGFGLAKHPGSGFGHDFRGWEFYANTRIAYGTVIVGDREYACPVPTSMLWRPDKVICTYRFGNVNIREEKFIAANDIACSMITSESPIMLRFDGHSLVIPKLSIDGTSKVRFDESNNAVHITEGGTVVTHPVENETCTGRLIYDGMSAVLSSSARITSYAAHTDDEGRQVYSFQVPCDRRGVAITWAMDTKKGLFWEIPLSTAALKDFDQISDVFASTPDTNYYAILGMYNCHVGRNANLIALAHLKRYNMHWGIPIAPEAWSKQPAPWGDQYSNLNAGKILLILEGMAGLEYSIPQSTLTVCDSMPEQWNSMELRIPMKVDGRMCWPKVLFQRKDEKGVVRKTISVSGNPLTHLKIQPWLEEGTVHSAPAGYAADNQGRNHIGYHFEDQPDASVTIEIEKTKK